MIMHSENGDTENPLIKEYSCGCVLREKMRGYCLKHWRGYFAGIETHENKCGDGPSHIDDDSCY